MNWPKYPVVFEINTWVWLGELTRKYNRALTLASIPGEEWDALAQLGIDAVWLMGVWERSPAGRAIALKNKELQADFKRALPDLRAEEVVGSPYCVRRYVVDDRLGGATGLAAARRSLAQRNIQLILDLVPNHVAPDHPWAFDHPEYFIRGDANDLRERPASFFEAGTNIYALGRDPYFAPWPDVLQLNAFHEGLRNAAIETLRTIAEQADGVRCDMAMLLINNVFATTWEGRAGKQPSTDYWATIIPAVKRRFANFLFIAEAYWDLEWELQKQGFDFCYDKRLYDRLCHENPERVRSHLLAEPSYQDRLVRFIENHDEPRAAAVFSGEKARAAAAVIMTLPGAKLLHEGQLDGRKVRLPVFLSRRPNEPADPTLRNFYSRLLKAVHREVFRNGRWALCERSGWPDNSSYQNLIACCWTGGDERYLIVANLSETRSQALVKVPWKDLHDRTCRLSDALSDEIYDRSGNEMLAPGLFVDVKGWTVHCFGVKATSPRQSITQVTRSEEAASSPIENDAQIFEPATRL